MLLVILSQLASAGGGPWVPGAGQLQVYAGVEGQRFTVLEGNDANGDPNIEVDVAGGISTLTGVLDLSYGVSSRTEVELILPYQHTHAKQADAPVCGLLGLGACRTTSTVGVIEGRVKTLVLDEVSGAPLSLAVGGVVRFGELTAAHRERITNAGEGTLDVGARVGVGRSGALGGGYWVANLDLVGLYRFPTATDFPAPDGDLTIPGPEVWSTADVLVAPSVSVAFGPTASFATRPGGLQFGEMLELAGGSVDRFASIRYTQARVGGKLVLQDEDYNAVSLSVTRTVYAVNNPMDTWSIGAGVSLNNLLGSKD